MRKIFFDKTLLIEAIIMIIACAVIIAFTVYIFFDGQSFKSDFDAIMCTLSMISLCVAMIILMIVFMPRYSSYYLINEKTIKIVRGRTALEIGTKFYTYVYVGYYVAWSRHVDYIVISRRRMNKRELSAINLQNDDKYLIRIRCTRKNLMILNRSLPERLKFQMEQALKDNPKKAFNKNKE